MPHGVQAHIMARAKRLWEQGISDTYMRNAVATILGYDGSGQPRTLGDAAKLLHMTPAGIALILRHLEANIHAPRPARGRPRAVQRAEYSVLGSTRNTAPSTRPRARRTRHIEHGTQHAEWNTARSDGMGQKRRRDSYITLAAAVAKYGVAQRVIERLIGQEKVETTRERGEALYVNDTQLAALALAGELVDVRASAAFRC